MIHCIIIEDEPPAREKLELYISKLPYLKLMAAFHSALEAMMFLKSNPVDLIFLDIEMKELTGIQLLESVTLPSKIIITSAYEKYAIKGFELQVNDYLLKPITFERFVKACDQVYDHLQREKNSGFETVIFVKTENRLQGIEIASILYIEGMGDYRCIVTDKHKIMTLQTFGDLMQQLPHNQFFRVHHSYAVALGRIEKIERNRIRIGDKTIPVSESKSEAFYQRIRR